MAKLIGIHRNTLFLVFLAILIFSDAVQGLIQVCDRRSLNFEGICQDNKACKDACIAEPDSSIIGGICQTTTSVSESAVTECVKNRMFQRFGRASTSETDCVDETGMSEISAQGCDEILAEFKKDCIAKLTVNTGERCTCAYLC